MMKLAKKFWNDEQGLEFSEYAVLLALICIGIIVSVGLLRDQIKAAFSTTASTISGNVAAGS